MSCVRHRHLFCREPKDCSNGKGDESRWLVLPLRRLLPTFARFTLLMLH